MQQQSGHKKYNVIGMMSGTSLDGVDLSLAKYSKEKGKWQYQLIAAKTYPYQLQHKKLIKQMQNEKLSFILYRKKEIEYSQLIVAFIKKFIEDFKAKLDKQHIDAIGLHGHTIFHNPKQGLTVQAVNLAYVAAKLPFKTKVIGNFRQLDVHRGGQGAPLAPFGEEIFGSHMYLNLGGIANVGYQGSGYDIVFCNMILNAYSQKIQQKDYDQNGLIGASGKVDYKLLEELYKIFENKDNHSLARQQANQFLESIQDSNESKSELINKMRTFYQLIASKITKSISEIKQRSGAGSSEQNTTVYCTGGGAFNKFLMSLLNQNQYNFKFQLPSQDVVNFKEALIFGLLAVKFLQNQPNCANGIGGQLVKG